MKKIAALLLSVVLVAATAVPAFAAGFTPSVENKGAPTVEKVVDKTGTTVDLTGDLIVTPVRDSNTASEAIKTRLNAAYNKLKTNSLRYLCGVSTIGGVSVDDLVVRDLFDVTVTGNYTGKLGNGNYLKITFKVSDASSLVGALFSKNGDEWNIIDGTKMVKNVDGTVTITIEDIGVVSFLYDNGKLPGGSTGHYAPQTSDPTWSIMGCVAAGGAVILAAVGMAEKRRSFGKQDA